jgi:hypothetical protein
MGPFFFDRELLLELAAKYRDSYKTAAPFPHAVIDDLLPEEVLNAVLAEFPKPEEITWWTFNDSRERKLATIDEATMGPSTRQLVSELNSAAFLDFLGDLTGIRGLVPDPHLYGGGLHQIERGGFLKVHADFNLHPVTGLERRLNLLIYLNKGWRSEFGGALELWDAEMTACGQRIEPVFNRGVVFNTSQYSYHGHPDPLDCPEGITRKSLALYYYSAPAVKDGRPVERTTDFRARPGEELRPPPPTGGGQRDRLRRGVVRWLPPVVTDGIRDHLARRRSRT